MRKVFLLLFGVFIMTSCAQVYFVTPQPQKGTVIKSFIDNLQGVYSDSLLTVEVSQKEIVVDGEHFSLVKNEPNEHEVLIRYYNDFYFASFKDSLYYSVFIGKFYEDKLAVYMLNADQRSIDILKRFVTAEQIDANGSYLINPSKKEFFTLFDSGVFDVVCVMKK